jgi:hypothetical protein
MSKVAIVAPDGNRVISLSGELTIRQLICSKVDDERVTRIPSIDTDGDWPFQFDRIYVPNGNCWRSYSPDYLPMKYW